jgi:hypothetical protein
MKAGIWRNIGKQPPVGLTPCSRYSFIISSLSCWRFSGPLYFARSFCISGCNACIASIDRVLLMVSGVISAMISTVRTMIATAYVWSSP